MILVSLLLMGRSICVPRLEVVVGGVLDVNSFLISSLFMC